MMNAETMKTLQQAISDSTLLVGELMSLLERIDKMVNQPEKRIVDPSIATSEKSKRPRVSFNEVIQIKQRSDKGEFRSSLAKEFGCDVRQIANYLAAANLEEPLLSAMKDGAIAVTYAPKIARVWGSQRIQREFRLLWDFAQRHSNLARKGKNGLITEGVVKAYEAGRGSK